LKPDDTYIENLLLAYSSTVKGINGAGLTDLRFAKEKELIKELNKVDFVSFGGKLKERLKYSPNKKKYQQEFKRLSKVIINKLSN
jgi:hypothetical protein